MHDAVFVGLAVLLFAVALGYAAGCDRLMKK